MCHIDDVYTGKYLGSINQGVEIGTQERCSLQVACCAALLCE